MHAGGSGREESLPRTAGAYAARARVTDGAPFDLDATPNLAKRLEEAGLAWPPTSPVNWPLKDW